MALAVFAARDSSDEGASDSGPASATIASLEKRFAVFRRPPRASDDPRRDPAVLRSLEDRVVRRLGINLEAGRRVSSSPAVFAVPGRGAVCLVSERGGSACSPDEVAGRNFVATSCAGLPSGVVAITGLVPDGARDPHIRLRDGRRVDADVADNYLSQRVRVRARGDVPVAVAWAGADYRVPRIEVGDLRCASR